MPYGSEPYRGTYIGYEEHNPNHKYEVWIGTAADGYSDMLNEPTPYHISNLNEGCIYTYKNYTRYSGYVVNGWNHFTFYRESEKGGMCEGRLNGKGVYDPVGRKIVLQYKYHDPNDKTGTVYINRKFIGTKK